MIKVLILGASGFMGSRIYKNLSSMHEVYGTYFSQNIRYENDKSMFKLDISMPQDFRTLLDKVKSQIIISSLRGNFDSQLLIHKIAARYLETVTNGKIIFLSSGIN